MAPRKNKNKIHDEGEPSATANKRIRRMELLNRTTGVPFTNPITQFPSIHFLQQQSRNPPRNPVAIDTDLQLSPPETIRSDDRPTADDDQLSSSLAQQNFLIGYHTNQMMQSVEEFWRRNFAEEVKKRKEMEEKLKIKDEQVVRFRQMYHFYEERTFLLEDMLRRRVAGEGCSADVAAVPEEQVESCFVVLDSAPTRDMACRNCRNRPANMLWLPCRHLCVCLVCERRVKICPICSVQKTESFMVNLPSP
ncbi:hypothetical protein L1887_08838 [Cichorium endivia]|nr:hypothetical protein L1887_08838 [Cichorium endivia]